MQYSIWKKIIFGTLVAFAVVLGCHFLGEVLYYIESPEKPVYLAEAILDDGKSEDGEAAPSGDAKPAKSTVGNGASITDDDVKPAGSAAGNRVADNPAALLASASVFKGAKLFKKCKACHTVKRGGKNTIGPNLWEVIGREIASSPGFKYSGVLKDKGGNWSFAELNAFLANPKKYAKGTKMSFRGIKKNEDRADLLVYLHSLSDNPKPLP